MATSSTSLTQATLAKTVLDLTTSLINASNSSNPVINGALEIGQWLGREKVNKYELADCLSKAKGIAFPNQRGVEFCDKVKEGSLQNPITHVFLKQSGSLGRMMVQDPWLCWIISTSACLFQFHNDTSLISDVVCTFIMHSQSTKEGRNISEFELRYQPERVQVKSVIDKIISSVWLNIVNAGQKTIGLPEELKEICLRGHHLHSTKFGVVIYSLQQPRERVIFRTRHFLSNIALWLILHFDGMLRVVVSGKTLYEKQQGSSSREIEMRVKLFCKPEVPCIEEDPELVYELLEDIAGQYKQFQSGTYPSSSDLRTDPGIRRKLYNIPQPYANDSRARKRTIQLLIKGTAQSIVRWLLQVPVVAQLDFSNFGFSVVLNGEPANSPLKISDLLSKSPDIINMAWGDPVYSKVVFTHAEHIGGHEGESQSSNEEMSGFDAGLEKERALEEVLPFFPILQDLLKEVKASCLCPRCRSDDETLDSLLQPGCLRRIAFNEVILLLAHSIADGFGCEDASAVSQTDSIVEGMVVALLELCEEKKVVWDTWFSTASSVFLGCPFKHHIMDIEFGGTTYAAIQYGNLVTMAPWLELSKEIKIQGCFALTPGRGRFGVATYSDDDIAQFRGVEETFAIIQTEHTEDTSDYVDRFIKEIILKGLDITIGADSTTVNSDMILVSAADNAYRILMRIRSPSHSRIVDPSDAIIRLARSIPSFDCQHKTSQGLVKAKLQQKGKLYTFDEVLGRWSNVEGFSGSNQVSPPPLASHDDHPMTTTDENDHGEVTERRIAEQVDRANNQEVETNEQQENGTIHFTCFLDSYLKYNVTLALAVNDAVVVNDKSSCVSCIQGQAKAVMLPADQQGDPQDRHIINRNRHLSSDTNRAVLKRKASEAYDLSLRTPHSLTACTIL